MKQNKLTAEAKEVWEIIQSRHDDRAKTNMFLSSSVYNDFKNYCKEHNMKPNDVLEILMQRFIGSFEENKKK